MKITPLFKKPSVLFFSVVLIASSLSALPIHAQDQQLSGAMILAPTEKLGVVAPGAVEDTLKACLARIPENATAGQRMLAEHSCRSEEGSRELLQIAPEF